MTGNVLDRLGGNRLLYKFANYDPDEEKKRRLVVSKEEQEHGAVINVKGSKAARGQSEEGKYQRLAEVSS